jgi:hypothetical protein
MQTKIVAVTAKTEKIRAETEKDDCQERLTQITIKHVDKSRAYRNEGGGGAAETNQLYQNR